MLKVIKNNVIALRFKIMRSYGVSNDFPSRNTPFITEVSGNTVTGRRPNMTIHIASKLLFFRINLNESNKIAQTLIGLHITKVRHI